MREAGVDSTRDTDMKAVRELRSRRQDVRKGLEALRYSGVIDVECGSRVWVTAC